MAALSPATAGFGACVVPSSRAECQCRVSVAERRCPHSASCQAEGTLASGGGGGARRENGWRNEALALPGAARKQFILSE